MEKLITIQKRNNLNEVYVVDKANEISNAHHEYHIVAQPGNIFLINFQNGPRNEEGSIKGVAVSDLLEISRHFLQSIQAGPYATRENALSLTAIEEALLWQNKRSEDRFEANKLGTNKI